MSNVTLSVQDQLLARSREYAAARGTSLNALIREYLESLTQHSEQDAQEFAAALRNSTGNSKGISWSRDSLYER